MVGNTYGWQQGPRWSEDTLYGSEDIRLSLMPGAIEEVMIDSTSRDLSSTATAINASGYWLAPGLVIAKSSSGVFFPVGLNSGNSPAVSPINGPHEQPFGILMEPVWLLDLDGSTLIDKPARVSRGGHHIEYSKVHDMYGNTNNMLPYFTRPDNPKYFKGIPFLFDQTYVSAGGATP